MIDYVPSINDWKVKVPAPIKKVLNKYFNKWEYAADGCHLREGSDVGSTAKICLVIEESSMYHYMQGEFGWEAHTDWHNTYTPEVMGWMDMLRDIVLPYHRHDNDCLSDYYNTNFYYNVTIAWDVKGGVK